MSRPKHRFTIELVYKSGLLMKDFFFFFQAEDGIRDKLVTGVQTCALPIWEMIALPLTAAVDPVLRLGVSDHLPGKRGQRPVSPCSRPDFFDRASAAVAPGFRLDRKSVV